MADDALIERPQSPAAPAAQPSVTAVGAVRVPFWRGLSGQLLALTVAFIFIAEVLIFVPSIAKFRQDWLLGRLNDAQTATLALEATPEAMIEAELEAELLANAGVLVVSLQRDETRQLILSVDAPPTVEVVEDLTEMRPLRAIWRAFGALTAPPDRHLLIVGYPRLGAGDMIEAVVREADLRRDMARYSANILALSVVISLIAGGLVFLTLDRLLVRPIRRMTANMEAFEENPEDPLRIIRPSGRRDEFGRAEAVLAEMQDEIRGALRQRQHLAALGEAVSKINHDLRNILTSAQLMSDRLSTSEDPRMRKLAPRLLTALDRAIALCQATLRYGKAEEAAPERERFALKPLVDELAEDLNLTSDGPAQLINAVETEFHLIADRDQVFRILMNLARNAAQAIETHFETRGPGRITIAAKTIATGWRIEVEDTGPGLPEKAVSHLFQAFKGSTARGGSGLGLTIARDLARNHGGDIILLRTGEDGTAFAIDLAIQES